MIVSKDSISVIIPALNEERNLEATVRVVVDAVKKIFEEYEIIIFNDGSTDRTAEVADKLAQGNENIAVIHHPRSCCLGGVYKQGIKLAKMTYIILVSGKDDTTAESLSRIFSLRGKADIIISFVSKVSGEKRSLIRNLFSRFFVLVLNSIFRLKLRYYNHWVLHKRAIINSLDIKTNSYAYQAEVLIKLIKSGYSYREVGVISKMKKGIKSKAFTFYNLFGVLLFLFRTIYEIYLKKEYRKIKIYAC
jgi:glycosyltransferase involved in cell wall biosynthesis